MTSRRTFRPSRRTESSTATKDRIVAAVRELMEQGKFHEASVEDIAKHAGVARATLYQHFGSRPALVDAICLTFDENPAVLALRASATISDYIEHTVEFWASEEKVL